MLDWFASLRTNASHDNILMVEVEHVICYARLFSGDANGSAIHGMDKEIG